LLAAVRYLAGETLVAAIDTGRSLAKVRSDSKPRRQVSPFVRGLGALFAVSKKQSLAASTLSGKEKRTPVEAAAVVDEEAVHVDEATACWAWPGTL
jgi:hypothetical protein